MSAHVHDSFFVHAFGSSARSAALLDLAWVRARSHRALNVALLSLQNGRQWRPSTIQRLHLEQQLFDILAAGEHLDCCTLFPIAHEESRRLLLAQLLEDAKQDLPALLAADRPVVYPPSVAPVEVAPPIEIGPLLLGDDISPRERRFASPPHRFTDEE